jgi:hypothetical protein
MKQTNTMTPSNQTVPSPADSNQDFAKFVELQQKHTEATNKLAALEVAINVGAQSAAQVSAPDYIVLQETVAGLEADLKALFARHPEWRGDKKSVATPYGSVDQRTVTELEVPNPAMTVALIKARGQAEPSFKSADYLHVTEEPDLESLERLNNDEMAKLGINRLNSERISVKPAKMNVAKAVKAAKKVQDTATGSANIPVAVPR